jgi:hypothetical protein
MNIFVSYSNANKKIVYKIADRLKVKHTIWIDRDYLKLETASVVKSLSNLVME